MVDESVIPTSRWIKCISSHGNLRGIAIDATELIQGMAALHKLTGQGIQGLGEAVIGAVLIGSFCKTGERVNLNIQGSKYFKQALVDAHPDGAVRGYLIERQLTAEEAGLWGDLGPWGAGTLSVLRTKGQEGKQPYIGTVPLLTGFLAKDLTFYWVQSEQIPSAVGLAVNIDETGKVTSAGGFLIQALPGASEAEILQIEQHINGLQSLSAQLAENPDPMNILSQIFQDTTILLVEERPVQFQCSCSWERVERALTLVGVAELSAMLVEDQHAQITCDFCTKEYRVEAEGLKQLILRAKGSGGTIPS